MIGYPAFALDSPLGLNVIYEETISTVGYRGFALAFGNDRYDVRDYKAHALELAGLLRPCSIIPRGHPARNI